MVEPVFMLHACPISVFIQQAAGKLGGRVQAILVPWRACREIQTSSHIWEILSYACLTLTSFPSSLFNFVFLSP